MLSRKYYKIIAQCIKGATYNNQDKYYNKVDKAQLIDLLSDEMKRDNINFNYTTFKDACN
tara:strand:+ start:187 stop:366 length:180 start_codon:yes stop_codon:yes gene_type:complete